MILQMKGLRWQQAIGIGKAEVKSFPLLPPLLRLFTCASSQLLLRLLT